MVDVDDVAAVGADEFEDGGEGAGPVGASQIAAQVAAGGGEAVLDEAHEQERVDVAARDDGDGGALVGDGGAQQGGVGGGAGRFDDELVAFEEGQQGDADVLFGDGDDLVDEIDDVREGHLAGFAYGDPVRDGLHLVEPDGLPGHEGLGVGGGAFGLDADDAEVGAQPLRGGGDAGDEPSAAHGGDDRVGLGQLVEDLQGDGALAGDDVP